jgi:hypothetical protein
MPLTKDQIDAVSIMLHVDGEPVFSLLLTRGGLTKRMGSSDATESHPVVVKGSTDTCFEDFMIALPDALLEEGGTLRDEGSDGPRHDWIFEFGGGFDSLRYDISYHWGSASLPDEFADMVVRAELLTHSWYVAGVAEETGVPLETPAESRPRGEAPVAAARPSKGSGPTRAKAAHPTSATRERMALVVLLDLLALSIPYSFVHWLLIGGAERTGPPGGALALFAIVEFALLRIVRRSPGYWLLGISVPLGEKPQVDPTRPTRESRMTLGVGVAMCGLGVLGLTSWMTYHAAVPYFGLHWPLWLSIPLTLLGSVASILAGALVLRLDIRGVWLGGGLALLLLLAGLTGWGSFPEFAEAALANWRAYADRPIGQGLVALARAVPLLLPVVPALLLGGLFESWKRLDGRSIPEVRTVAA